MSALTTIQPAQADIIRLIESNPKLQPSTKKQYVKAITKYLDSGDSLTDTDALAAYAQGLSKSSRAFLKAAIRLWGEDIALKAKAGATPQNIGAVQATVYRIEALNEVIKVEGAKGQKAHTWLTQTEVRRLMATCSDSIQGQRDRAVLGLLVGAGLRREELANFSFEDVVIQPMGNRPRTVLNVKGKGAKDRAVPISDALAELLDNWKAVIGSGLVARSITKGGAVGNSLSVIGIFHIVSQAGQAIGKGNLAPHDLRRTYAQLGYEAGLPITQISKLLGHASVATTQRYLNLELDLETTVSDFVPIG
ncbi:MAG: site-specific integrase [Anaerolineae bacterium]|nr:site-specific integrase [Anaerolineae bacterium]